ncbi:DUF2087 domain-containing protein [Calidifontibacter sp. DB0510]|uniref:DUF2087 domain-containing protein n=1 Tax=Metallococcus carri TaxID=1656884 RepID=A0A967B2T6_9MICO|nr:DUF2087 domain-containing protein [Metallococcus carri]NHN56230.1 DUF2087 domain-containing protein [Metallococcus carri]NOP38719.1 DUF2087 domain-containing protein [Calidifontibacter sp. DB2511S]
MTTDHDFKQLVRARMRETGENYTTALMALRDDVAYREAEREQHRIVARWFDDGRLRDMPARRAVRAAVLLEVLSRFEPGRRYREREVTALLSTVYADHAWLRRLLVEHDYLERADGEYWVVTTPPVREGQRLTQETPAWELAWLPRFITRGTR